MLSLDQIANKLPDIPTWVEVRDLLFSEECEVFGVEEHPDLAFVLHAPDEETVYVVGLPSDQAIQKGVKRLKSGSIVTLSNQAERLRHNFPYSNTDRIYVYGLRTLDHLRPLEDIVVRFVEKELLEKLQLPSDLLEELTAAVKYSLISAAFVEQRPVSFCYVASETESWWDVSIDTLSAYRRRGYAGVCFFHLAQHMLSIGKYPVWQALMSNPASFKLAEKLGFEKIDEFVVFNLK